MAFEKGCSVKIDVLDYGAGWGLKVGKKTKTTSEGAHMWCHQ